MKSILAAFIMFIGMGCPLMAGELTQEEIKKLFNEEVIRHGYIMTSGAKDALNEAAPRIAQTAEEMKGVQRHVEEIAGKKEGVFHAVFPNGNVQALGHYKNDKRTGVFLFYYPNGVMYRKEYYDEDGSLDGQVISYHRNGNIEYVTRFIAGKPEGPKITYYESGAVYQVTTYHVGVMSGFSHIFYENGTLKKVGTFKNGLQEGEVIFYNPDGTLKERVNYSEGKRTP